MPGTPSRHVDRRLAIVVGVVIATVLSGCSAGTPSAAPVTLRLQVGLTPEELATFQPAIAALDAAHPEWVIAARERAAGVGDREGHQPARRRRPARRAAPAGFQCPADGSGANAFLDLTDRVDAAKLDLADFYDGAARPVPLEGRPLGPARQRLARDRLLRREGVRRRRRRAAGRHLDLRGHADRGDRADRGRRRQASRRRRLRPEDDQPAGAGTAASPTTGRTPLIQGLGGELCATADCTTMSFTGPANQAAFDWWVGLVHDDHAAPVRPVRRLADRGARRPVHLGQGGDGLERDVRHRPAQRRRHDRLRHRPAAARHGREAAHAAQHQRLRPRRRQRAPGRGMGPAPGADHARLPGLDLGQARPCGAGSPVRGVIGHRHLARAGEPGRDPRGDGGRARSSGRTPPARATPTTGRSTCSRR